MPDLSDPQSIYFALALIVPGLVVTFVRAQFTTGRMQNHSDALLSYFTLSAVYAAIALPLLGWLHQPLDRTVGVGFWFGLIFLGPAAFGAILGVSTRTEWLRRILHKFSINPVHAMPTAWDWKFGNMKEQLVIVTLKNDVRFAGYCGRKSFFSSDPTERDVFIEKIYDWGDDDSWNDGGEHGLWVASGEIRTIEFFPVSEKGTPND